jgi:predicted transcriptional regulator of viral defense system
MLSHTDRILALVRQHGILRPRDLGPYAIPPASLYHLVDTGAIERVGRGLYSLPDAEASESHSLAEACKRVPQGIICLLSALAFHGLGTQSPFEVWMALDRKARRPRLEYPPLRIARFSGSALTEGIEEHPIEGVTVRLYNPAKTVVDCFKYRNKVGLDVALEALRDCRRQRVCTNDQLWHYAQVCRVTRVIQPYLEATL